MICRIGVRIRYPGANRTIALAAAALGVPMIAILMSGCWYAALSLAPMGLNAAEGVTVAAAGTVAPKKSDEEDTNPEHCDELTHSAPWITELRAKREGGFEARNLSLTQPADKPQWTVVSGDEGGWHEGAKLTAVDFTPPLRAGFAPGSVEYLAYAPAQPQTGFERDQLVSLIMNFGPSLGTFHWNGRPYQYGVAATLPCFPPPS
jgi:hypothetical protein